MIDQIRILTACLALLTTQSSCASTEAVQQMRKNQIDIKKTRVQSHYDRVVPLVTNEHLSQCHDKFDRSSGYKMTGAIRPSLNLTCIFVLGRMKGLIWDEWDKNSPIAVFAAPIKGTPVPAGLFRAKRRAANFYWCRFMRDKKSVKLSGHGIGGRGAVSQVKFCGLKPVK